MARDRDEVLGSLKVGEAVEISNFMSNMTSEKIVATCIDITPQAKIFDASLFGIHVGLLEYRPGDKEPFFMEDPR